MQAQKPNIARIFFYYNIKNKKSEKLFTSSIQQNPANFCLPGSVRCLQLKDISVTQGRVS